MVGEHVIEEDTVKKEKKKDEKRVPWEEKC
jgi:hypothetical protein